MSTENAHFFEFGAFRLDPREKLLFCDNEPVSVTPKVFETLQVFLENPGRLLEKDELMQKIWQDRFVEEGNLPFTIKTLRRVLKDDAHHPRYIETVPRRGYRFIADVRRGFDEPPAEVKSKSLAGRRGPKRSFFAAVALAIVIACGIAAFFFFGAQGKSSSISSVPLLAAPLKSEKFGIGNVGRAVISPNGEYVAYTTETGGKESIWLRRLETSENIQIVPPTNETYLGLAISHDGNSLYFVRRTLDERQTSAIYRVMTFGGIPVKITDRSEGSVSLSPDDKQLLFTRCNYSEEDFCSLILIDADGGNERNLVTRRRPTRLSAGEFSPDGRSVAFASGQSWSGGSDFRLILLDLVSSSEKQVSPKTFFEIKHLKWLPDGNSLLLTARESLDGTARIWHSDVGTGNTREINKDATDYSSISLDKTASRMIATRSSNTFHLYMAGIDNLKNARSLASARLGVAFVSATKVVYEGNDGDLWTINIEGGERRQLTNNSFNNFNPRVSRSGRHIFFTSNRSGSNQIWRVNADGGDQTQITKSEGGYPKQITPDGKWLYYESSLHRTLWRVPAEGGEEQQILQQETPWSAVSPDGQLVGYSAVAAGGERRASIAVISIGNEGLIKTLSRPDSSVLRSVWAYDGDGIYFIASAASGNSLWYQPLGAPSPRLLGDLGSEEIADFALSPDGRTIAFIRGRWVNDAVLIEGLGSIQAGNQPGI
jgi:Tol biopolymer transport system component/DNA-binding winged helix-turn-helix (wHTH) protein